MGDKNLRDLADKFKDEARLFYRLVNVTLKFEEGALKQKVKEIIFEDVIMQMDVELLVHYYMKICQFLTRNSFCEKIGRYSYMNKKKWQRSTGKQNIYYNNVFTGRRESAKTAGQSQCGTNQFSKEKIVNNP